MDLLDRIRAQLDLWPTAPLHVSLFGSLARSTAGTRSDVDLLVVRPDEVAADDEGWTAGLAELETRVLRWTGNTLSWFETTRDGLEAAVLNGEPLAESWRNEAIHLYGTRLPRLLPAGVR